MSEPGQATTFAQLTTMRVGGTFTRLVEPETEASLIDTVQVLSVHDEPWLLLGGGSNTIAADIGFDGTVVRVATRGIQRLDAPSGEVLLRVQAGEDWDGLVAHAVAHGWAGIEALSGIPGRVGAAPVQNIGAYGQELSDVLVAVDFLDDATGEVRRMSAGELELGYRSSVIKRGLRGVVVAVELRLHEDAAGPGAALSAPVAYAQLANALAVSLGDRVPLAELRRTVLALRASKGMVLDPGDPDSVSAGSFFTNPIVSEGFARSLPPEAPRWPLTPDEPDLVVPLVADTPDGAPGAGLGLTGGATVALAALEDAARDRAARQAHAPRLVKLSAAWLIEQSGIGRGFALPGSRVAISSKHTLAITNRGGATADEVVQLASLVQGRVQSEFGVLLQPEPVLVGLEL